MAAQPIVIYGAGGHAREVAWLLDAVNARGARFRVLGFLDDAPENHGLARNDLPILGGSEWIDGCGEDRLAVVLGIGSPGAKHRIVRRLRPLGVEFPVVVHPDVPLCRWVELGEGTTITYGCSLTVDVTLGSFVFLNRHVTVGHDARIGSYANLNPGVVVSGNDDLGEGVDIGTGTVIIQQLRVGEGAIVGAGASVVRDLPPNVTAVGVPARPVRENPDWRTR